jgi:hypothetical protein
MSETELANAALMRQYYEEVFNRRNLSRWRTLQRRAIA